MRFERAVLTSVLVLAAGCSMVAGVQDIVYGDPAATDPAPIPDPSAEGGPATTADGSSTGTPDEDATTVAPSEDAAADGAGDAEVDAADAADAADPADPPDDDPPPAPGALPGCTQADFLANDRRAPDAPRTITFPVVAAQPQYAPRCMRIRAGQSVTWEGDFAIDPLAARSQNPPSPIAPVAAGLTATFTFAKKGRYRYGSTANPAMYGAIDVRP